MAAQRILVRRSQSFPRSSTAAVTISRSGCSSCVVSTCQYPYRWPKICVMSLSRTSSWLGTPVRVLFTCAISHSKNVLRCASRLTSGTQYRRSPRGIRSPFPNGTMDRFIFIIKLADVVSRAEKSLYLAVRYSVSGCEIWDNNSGRNYHVQIVREKVPKANKEPRRSSLRSLRSLP